MAKFNKILTLSKQIAAALLQDKQPTALQDSNLFNQQDKQDILDQLTKDERIKERLLLANQINKKEDWKKLKSKIEVPVRKLYYRYAAAAVVVIALASTYFLKDTLFNSPVENNTTLPTIVNNQIEPGTDRAILTLENGEEITLEKGQSVQTANATSNGEELIYTNNQQPTTNNQIAYNTLTVPRGAQHYVLLSDGTKVWLNSESQIRYPVSFTKGQTRQVELLYGEAYFDVTSSTQNQGAGFKVAHKGQEVAVLGTQFNIKAYNDETSIYTTLVEGKVSVTPTPASSNHHPSILAPTEQAVLNLTNNNIAITNIDVYAETSWKDGIFNFKGKTLKEVMQVLSRWYDMEVVFENKDLETVKFRGVIRKSKPIEEILTIMASTSIGGYEINNKTITIK